ncbi:Acetamidase [Triangularia verruculosa]|uniref:Acetamidase n=1 Tax=Triangularia verruculosa TaxID=2587418 RepID=A0AAN7AZU9_9PEZI|nr:Acetamidase [Triangularia verruculosa]
MSAPASNWQSRATEKRASILARISLEWRLSPEDLAKAEGERDITGLVQEHLEAAESRIVASDATAIVSLLRDGTFSATQVATAFCKAAAIAHQIGNCLHEVFFDQAMERAKELDTHFQKTGTVCGPLHGLPISLKDQFHVKGMDTTMGYIESQITTELLSLGAILYCKTSLPQTLLFGETKNNIIGETVNPHNRKLSCGGSSGGEGALQALGGSVLGVGTDIGGSVRIPAAFNGIFSLKPTPERLSYRDVANTNPGQNTYRSTVGFLSTSIAGLELALRATLSTEPWLRDPAVVPIPFRQEIFELYRSRAEGDGKASSRPLKLGILWTDRSVGPHPPIIRGLRQVVEAVKAAGHKIVDWDPPLQATAKRVHVSFLLADGGHDIHSHLDLSGEPLIPDLEEAFELKPPMDLLEYQRLTLEGLDYEQAYSDYWNSTAVDAVIMPVAPHAAVIPGKYYHTAYTEVINLMNYSAAVIPVTKADKSIDVPDITYEPLNDVDKKNWEAYDPEIYDGAPVGVQLVARKFEEEKILAIAEIVSACLARC